MTSTDLRRIEILEIFAEAQERAHQHDYQFAWAATQTERIRVSDRTQSRKKEERKTAEAAARRARRAPPVVIESHPVTPAGTCDNCGEPLELRAGFARPLHRGRACKRG